MQQSYHLSLGHPHHEHKFSKVAWRDDGSYPTTLPTHLISLQLSAASPEVPLHGLVDAVLAKHGFGQWQLSCSTFIPPPSCFLLCCLLLFPLTPHHPLWVLPGDGCKDQSWDWHSRFWGCTLMGTRLLCIFLCFSLCPSPSTIASALKSQALWVQRDAPSVCIYLPSLRMLSWVHCERYCLSLDEKQGLKSLGTSMAVISLYAANWAGMEGLSVPELCNKYCPLKNRSIFTFFALIWYQTKCLKSLTFL